jgi:hypothetical protein
MMITDHSGTKIAILDEYSLFSAIFEVDFPSRVDYCKSVPFQPESGFYQVD